MRNTGGLTLAFVVAILLAAALVACGSPSTPTATHTPAALAAPTPTATGTPVLASTDAPPAPSPTSSTATSPISTPTGTAVPSPTTASSTLPPASTPVTPEAATPTSTATPAIAATASVQPTPQTLAEELPTELATRLAGEAMRFLTKLTEELSPRASGTEEERRAAESLARAFEEMGYVSALQPFQVEVISSELVVTAAGAGEPQEFRSFRLRRGGMGTATAALTSAGRAFPNDLPAEGLEGKIALIERGEITFEEKVTRVGDAGALAAVVYNNVAGLFGGTLMDESPIPAVAISREDGEAILKLMQQGEVEATVSVTVETRDSQNVIADKPGSGGDGAVVVLGGHYDTVENVPGANDNGSGTATLVTIAREVSDRTYPFAVRFIAFGSEELGLLGSRFYVDSLSEEQRESTVAMLNFDALAAGGEALGVLGDSDLVSQVAEYGENVGIDLEPRRILVGGSSDHASFQQVGIPVLFFLTDDFSRIHTSDDRLEFVNPRLMGDSAALAIALLDTLLAR